MTVASLPVAQPVGSLTPASSRITELDVSASANFEEKLLISDAVPVARDLDVIADPVLMVGLDFSSPSHVPGDTTDTQITTQELSRPSDDLERSLAPFYDLAFGQALTLVLPQIHGFNQITPSAPAPDETIRTDMAGAHLASTKQPVVVSSSALEQLKFVPPVIDLILTDDAKLLSVSSKAFHEPVRLVRPPVAQIAAATLEDVGPRGDPEIGINGSANNRARGSSLAGFDRIFVTTVPSVGVDSQQSRLDLPVANSHVAASSVGSSAKTDLPQQQMAVRNEGIVVQQLAAAVQSLIEGDAGVVTEDSSPTVPSESLGFQPKLRVLDIILQPQELGRVSIRMRLSGSGLSVLLEAENAATRMLLQQEAVLLSERMSADGYDVENVSVQQLFVTPPLTKSTTAHVPHDVFRLGGGGEHPGAGGGGGQGADNQRPRSRKPVGVIEGAGLAEPAEPARDPRNHLYV